ncbi:aldose epimerase family protein [Stenotrophomonas sp. CFBP8980]|jgi:aldose 1-epimerase|nr:aldose epimerase family protein [Stenotrophomonas sp. CFBP8980]
MVMLENAHGLRAEIAQRGAALAAMWVPDRDGQFADVVLGHAEQRQRTSDRSFFGASIGRVAGRISTAGFLLEGQHHPLDSVDGLTTHHGGPDGFDARDWQWLGVRRDRARLQLVSPHGDQGFPGALTVTVDYRLDDTDTLHVDYAATCDRPTVVNLTHHPFWNLAGEGAGAVDAHLLTLPASRMVALSAALTPTGQRPEVAGSAFDFRRARLIGEALSVTGDPQLQLAGGLDHYWILDAPADAGVRPAARLHDPHSGRVLDVLSDQAGVQVYSGNFLDGSLQGASGRPYHAHAAICIEPQAYPDAMNQPALPDITLQPGAVYRNRIRYRFSKDTP